MPVSPDDAVSLGKGLREVYSDAELRLLDLIGQAVSKGIDAPTWREQQLIAVQKLRAQTATLVRDLDKAGTAAAADAVMAGYNRGAAVAGVDLARLGGDAARGAFGGVDARAVSALTAAAGQQIRDTGLVIKSQQEAIYRDVVQQTAGRMLTTGMTRRDASWDAMQEWADKGVTGFVDRGGRSWQMTSYAEMIGRTAASQAIMQGHRDRLVDSGNDLVMISDAPEECVKCRPWEGKILSLTGRTRPGTYTTGDGSSYTVAGTLAAATSAGLFHPNCRHRTVAYFPGITPPLVDTEDPEGDKLRQQQRYRERHIRQLKRRAQTSKSVNGPRAPATVAANRRLRTAQAGFKSWRDVNGRKDLAYRTSIRTPTARPRPVPDQSKPKRQPRPVPPDVVDWNSRELRSASDSDLDAALGRALEADHPNTDRLIRELDRRDEAPLLEAARQEKRRLAAESRKEAKAAQQSQDIADLIGAGVDEREAIERVTGITIAKQLRIELTYRLRGEGVLGKTLDEMLRSKFREHRRISYLAAEDATNGYLLNKAGIARGVDPYQLFSGSDAAARKYASSELLEWWDQNGGRLTFEDMKQDLLTGIARKDSGQDYYA